MISTEHVSKCYGTAQVSNDCTTRVEKGEVVVVFPGLELQARGGRRMVAGRVEWLQTSGSTAGGRCERPRLFADNR